MRTIELKPRFELVSSVTDYWDGPIKGIANYQGRPHFHEAICDDAKDEFSQVLNLTPVDEETFNLAMEAWAISKRSDSAFHAGKVDLTSHPALPEDASRSAELKAILGKALPT